MPSTSKGILRQLQMPMRKLEDWTSVEWKGREVTPGSKLGKAEYLFKMIEEKKADEFSARYGGAQTVAAAKKPKDPEIDAKIKAQGEVVRKLKAEKADPAIIKGEVAKLLALKKQQ